MNKYTNNLVSVIIPTYNSARYLSIAIESALSQTYPYTEIIVIDDGSTDNTYKIILPYLNKIKYIKKINGGPASARNYGLLTSNGEYIAFLDADDYWLPGKLEQQIDYLQRNPGVDLVHSNTWILDEKKRRYPVFNEKKPPSGNVFEELFKSNHICNLTVVVRHACIEKFRFNERSRFFGSEDYELWLRISQRHKIAYLDRIVSVYRIHSTNISSELKNIYGQLHILNEIYLPIQSSLNKQYPKIINKKKKIIYFRWACCLMELGHYDDAKKRFAICFMERYALIKSLLGILCCIFKSNVIFKSRSKSLEYDRYASYLLEKKKIGQAKRNYLKSFLCYPLKARTILKILGIEFQQKFM